jgi:hypothetical protein
MRKMIVILFAAALLLLISNGAWAQQQGEGEKRLYHTVEYTDRTDDTTIADSAHNGADPGQVLLTTVSDFPGPPKPKCSSFDYDITTNTQQVDALANAGDAYYLDMRRDVADLLVSFEGDPGNIAVWWEAAAIPPPQPIPPRRPMWVHDSLSNQGAANPDPNFHDLDALETYGPGDADDANRCSFQGDFSTTGSYSVWKYGTPPTGWILQADIVTALQSLGWSGTESWVDVDALMVSEYSFEHPGGEIIFSIVATGKWAGGTINAHGGELIVMPVAAPASAYFLTHGGHLWDFNFRPDTAFNVPTCEIDGIEAWGPIEDDPPPDGDGKVPALTNWGLLVLLVLLILSGIYVIYHRRKGVVRA